MSGRGYPLFRVFGIQVKADASWLIILALVVWSLAGAYFPQVLPGLGRAAYWGMGIVASLLFFGSVLLHELSHSLVALHFGLPVHGITLFVFGGVSEIGEEPPSPKVEFWMSLAGPAMSFLLAGLFWFSGRLLGGTEGPPAAMAILVYLAFINGLLGAFNLIPGFPLDGGRILRAALWGWTGDMVKATRWAANTGKGFAGILIGLGAFALLNGMLFGGLWYGFIGMFLWKAADVAYQQLLVTRQLRGLTVADVMSRPAVGVPADISLEALVTEFVFAQRYAAYPVLEDEQPIGVIALSDVRAVPREAWARTPVRAVMTPTAATLTPEMALTDALKVFGRTNQRRLPVADHDQLVGVLSMTDVADALQLAEFRRDRYGRPAA